MKQVSTRELAEILGVSIQRVTAQLSKLTLLTEAKPDSLAGRKTQAKRIAKTRDWFGGRYVSHQMVGGRYVITIRE